MESTIGGWVRSKLRVFEPRSDPCGVLGLRTDQGQGPAVSFRPRDPWRRPGSSFGMLEVDRPSSVILAEFCAAPGGSESGV